MSGSSGNFLHECSANAGSSEREVRLDPLHVSPMSSERTFIACEEEPTRQGVVNGCNQKASEERTERVHHFPSCRRYCLQLDRRKREADCSSRIGYFLPTPGNLRERHWTDHLGMREPFEYES